MFCIKILTVHSKPMDVYAILVLIYLLVFADNSNKIQIFNLSSIIMKYGKYEPEL